MKVKISVTKSLMLLLRKFNHAGTVAKLVPVSLILQIVAKNLFTLIVFLMCASLGMAQNKPFPKKAFAGAWEHEQSHNNLVLIIKFEKGKDYATFIDVGTGEAPSVQFNAQMQGDKLLINPQTHVNDFYIQLAVKNNKLIFKTQIAIWDRSGNPLPADENRYLTRIYKRVK